MDANGSRGVEEVDVGASAGVGVQGSREVAGEGEVMAADTPPGRSVRTQEEDLVRIYTGGVSVRRAVRFGHSPIRGESSVEAATKQGSGKRNDPGVHRWFLRGIEVWCRGWLVNRTALARLERVA